MPAMSKKSVPLLAVTAEKARAFLRAAAARYFPQAVTWPEDPRHRAIVDALLHHPHRVRDSLAASISMTLEVDLTAYLPPCDPIPRYAPGMTVIIHRAKEYREGELLFIAGGALGWDKGISLSAKIGESLPDNGPGGSLVRLATEAEAQAAIASLDDTTACRIARMVIAGALVASPRHAVDDDPFDLDNL